MELATRRARAQERLASILVVDPARGSLAETATACARYADDVLTAKDLDEAHAILRGRAPSLAIVSQVLSDAPSLQALRDRLHVALSYRELSVERVAKLRRDGVVELLHLPLDIAEVAPLLWRRFGVDSREHTRFPVAVEVSRADGEPLGVTDNLSEAGMLLVTPLMLRIGDSMLADLRLPTGSVRARAEVLAQDRRGYRASFTRLQTSERDRLTRFLAGLLAPSGTPVATDPV